MSVRWWIPTSIREGEEGDWSVNCKYRAPSGYSKWTKPDAGAFIQMFNTPVYKRQCTCVLLYHAFLELEWPNWNVVIFSIGFTNHFVFGTAHHNRVILEMLAATWVPSDEPGAAPLNTVPTMGEGSDLAGSLSTGGDATSGEPRTPERVAGSNTELTTEDIIKYNKVAVYSIATYSMQDVESLLVLYLLMRQTRILVRQYKQEIRRDGSNRIKQLTRAAGDIYKWPPPPLSESNRGFTTSSKQRELDDVSEEDSMSVDQYDISESRSDFEELESLSDTGRTRTVIGEVATYTVRNYAYHGGAAGA
ncbi:hypothetical protein B0J17DRAFT_631064 [Rhizoctonia solani]|nr:hypothetical protein B0J17DRAFT_631064 [Rhizoctonia solani]